MHFQWTTYRSRRWSAYWRERLKINYILDPRVGGAVTIHTYGEVKQVDLMPMLQTILRVNSAAIVQVGDLYHIVPIASVSNLPTDPLLTPIRRLSPTMSAWCST